MSEVKCLTSGEWSTNLGQICKQNGQCKELVQSTSNGVHFKTCHDRSVGSICHPSCGNTKDVVLKVRYLFSL